MAKQKAQRIGAPPALHAEASSSGTSHEDTPVIPGYMKARSPARAYRDAAGRAASVYSDQAMFMCMCKGMCMSAGVGCSVGDVDPRSCCCGDGRGPGGPVAGANTCDRQLDPHRGHSGHRGATSSHDGQGGPRGVYGRRRDPGGRRDSSRRSDGIVSTGVRRVAKRPTDCGGRVRNTGRRLRKSARSASSARPTRPPVSWRTDTSIIDKRERFHNTLRPDRGTEGPVTERKNLSMSQSGVW